MSAPLLRCRIMSSLVSESSSSSSSADASDKSPAKSQRSSRLPIIISLVLALLFVVAVIGGARMYMEKQAMVPVAMGPVDAPDAESQTCTDFVGNLPEDLKNYQNVGVVDPAPAGSAAYRNLSGAELTIRCGVRLPDQFTELSETTEAGGAQWFEVKDATPGSELRTWYSVNASPAIAVTSDSDLGDELAGVGEATSSFTGAAPQPGKYPLSDLRMSSSSSDATSVCSAFLKALPDSFDGYRREERDDAPSQSATYLSTNNAEPVVVRCGAAMPDSYGPGEQITQVNDVAWFAEPKVAQGSTTGTWYALSHQQIVAVSMPNTSGNAAVNAVTKAIQDTMKKENQR